MSGAAWWTPPGCEHDPAAPYNLPDVPAGFDECCVCGEMFAEDEVDAVHGCRDCQERRGVVRCARCKAWADVEETSPGWTEREPVCFECMTLAEWVDYWLASEDGRTFAEMVAEMEGNRLKWNREELADALGLMVSEGRLQAVDGCYFRDKWLALDALKAVAA